MAGDGDAHPVGIVEHDLELGNGLAPLGVPVITVGAVKNVDIVILGQVFVLDDFIDQLVGGRYLGAAGDFGIVVGVKVRHLLGRGVVKYETGLHLVGILVEQPAVYHDVLGHDQFSGFAGHGARVVPDEKDHGLGFEILFAAQNAVDHVLG